MNQLVNEFEEITRWPKKKSDKEYIIKYLSEKFHSGKEYLEKEVNQIIGRHHSFNDIFNSVVDRLNTTFNKLNLSAYFS